jgi:AraC-like DNA-binding protein
MARKSEGTRSDDDAVWRYWNFLERKKYIEQAELPEAKANDGSTVSVAAMKALLYRVNDRLGENVEAWPSQVLLSKETGLSTKQISRASEALQSLSLMIVILKKAQCGVVMNHYRIVWSELLLLDPERRRNFVRMIREPTDRSDMTADRSDMTADRSDMTADRSDTMSAKQLTNNSGNNPKNNSPLPSQRDRAAHGGDPWEVVVSDLRKLEMGDARGAVRTAQQRGMAPETVTEWIARYVQLTAADSSITIGHLHRWLTGRSKPPWLVPPKVARMPSNSLMSESTRRTLNEIALRKRLQQEGKSLTEIDDIVTQRMQIGSMAAVAIGNAT